MRTLIIPCAGQSTRFNTDLPKWLLDHPSGKTMVYESIQGLPLDSFDVIVITCLSKHLTDDLRDRLCDEFAEIDGFMMLELEEDTKSASDTVSQTIETMNLEGSIFIKDSDDYFYIEKINPNEICTYSLNDCKNITPGNKSYIKKNSNGEVLTIVEKKVISSDFCCGMYSFKDAREFVNVYKSIKEDGEIYISHVIFKMLLNGESFYSTPTSNFLDWGTQEDWDMFLKNYIFIYTNN